MASLSWNWVTHRLATGGGIADDMDVGTLLAAGVNFVIDCRSEFDDAELLAQHPQIAYLFCGTDDDGKTKPPEWFAKGIDFALAQLTHPHRRGYIHSAAGLNRGPSMLYAVLIAFGINFSEAMEILLNGRPEAHVDYAADAERAVQQLGYVRLI
jgi:hypothetical protein